MNFNEKITYIIGNKGSNVYNEQKTHMNYRHYKCKGELEFRLRDSMCYIVLSDEILYKHGVWFNGVPNEFICMVDKLVSELYDIYKTTENPLPIMSPLEFSKKRLDLCNAYLE